MTERSCFMIETNSSIKWQLFILMSRNIKTLLLFCKVKRSSFFFEILPSRFELRVKIWVTFLKIKENLGHRHCGHCRWLFFWMKSRSTGVHKSGGHKYFIYIHFIMRVSFWFIKSSESILFESDLFRTHYSFRRFWWVWLLTFKWVYFEISCFDNAYFLWKTFTLWFWILKWRFLISFFTCLFQFD